MSGTDAPQGPMSPEVAAGWLGTMIDGGTPPMAALALQSAIDVLNDVAQAQNMKVALPDAVEAAQATGSGEAQTFTQADLTQVVVAMNTRKAFYAFVQRRFYEVAALGYSFDAGVIGMVTVNDLPEDHWTDWRVPAGWEDGYQSLLVMEPYVPVQRFTKNPESGNEIAGAVIQFDLDVLFGADTFDAEYETFLRLKRRFEPSA